jgi:hypothetical protein
VRRIVRSSAPIVLAASTISRSMEAKPSVSVTSGSVTKKMAWLITTVHGAP